MYLSGGYGKQALNESPRNAQHHYEQARTGGEVLEGTPAAPDNVFPFARFAIRPAQFCGAGGAVKIMAGGADCHGRLYV